MRRALFSLLLIVLAGCSSSPPPEPPHVTLPAELPPLKCADLGPPPVHLDPKPKIVGRSCTNPDGSILWGLAIYVCTDGSIWPVLGEHRGVPPVEPEGPAFDTCTGRSAPTT